MLGYGTISQCHGPGLQGALEQGISRHGLVRQTSLCGHRRPQICARSSPRPISYLPSFHQITSLRAATTVRRPCSLIRAPIPLLLQANELYMWTTWPRQPSTTLPSAYWLAPQAEANAKLAPTMPERGNPK